MLRSLRMRRLESSLHSGRLSSWQMLWPPQKHFLFTLFKMSRSLFELLVSNEIKNDDWMKIFITGNEKKKCFVGSLSVHKGLREKV